MNFILNEWKYFFDWLFGGGSEEVRCCICGNKTTDPGHICGMCQPLNRRLRWTKEPRSFGNEQAREPPPEEPPLRAPSPSDPHAVLGVPLNASASQIRRAYHRLMRKHHPDLFAHLGVAEQARATQRAQIINRAYDALLRKSR